MAKPKPTPAAKVDRNILTAIELNAAVLEMKLNASNKNSFKRVILFDVFNKRTTALDERMDKLLAALALQTFGKTAYMQNKNKLIVAKLEKDVAAAKKSGVHGLALSAAFTTESINVNMAGRAFNMRMRKFGPRSLPGIEANYVGYKETGVECTKYSLEVMTSSLALEAGHPLIDEWDSIREESTAMAEASVELTAILDTLFGRAKTLGQAVERWPEITAYAPSILSACREMVVNADDLNAKINELRSGTGSAKAAIASVSKTKK